MDLWTGRAEVGGFVTTGNSATAGGTESALPKSKSAHARRDSSKAAPPPASDFLQRVAHADLAARFSIEVIDRVRIAPQVAALMRNIAISDADTAIDIGDNEQFSQYLTESPVLSSRDGFS